MSWFSNFLKPKAVEPTVPVEVKTPATVVPTETAAPAPSLFKRLSQGLSKTRQALGGGLARVFLGRKEIDEELLEQLETTLLKADVGIAATERVMKGVTERLKRKELQDPQVLLQGLQQTLADIVAPCEKPLVVSGHKPYVILMVGVNGAGKTTTIGKLAKRLQQEGKSVILAAGDTFRAAAVEQLQVWGERNQIPVIAQHTGADSASVIFDTINAAKTRGIDVVIADTAGRLHTKVNLMEELKKVVRVIQKTDPTAPHEIMLVIDASMGQNALAQAEQFHKAVPITGITLTKLDGTAKGGVIFAIAEQLKLPIRFIGVGEQLDDLRPFQASDFVAALFEDATI